MKLTLLEEAQKALDKADLTLHNARHDLAGGFSLATANRAYYACYYCMVALLYTKDVHPKTHQGVHLKFSELFIKPGLMPPGLSETISLLFDYRQEADYDFDADVTAEEAGKLIDKASEFVALAKHFFKRLRTEYGNADTVG